MQQWNPSQTNQETDAAYTADSQRSGGATNPSIFASILANKLFYQMTTYLVALFTAFANKGFTTSDASLATLTAQCANFLTTADVRPDMLAATFASTMTLDFSKANGYQITLTGNTTLTFTNLSFGQTITLAFVQDGTGGRTVSWPGVVVSPASPDTTPNASSIISFKVLLDGNLHSLTPMAVS